MLPISRAAATRLESDLIYGPQHIDADGVSVPAGSLTLTGGHDPQGPLRPGRGADPRRLRSVPEHAGELTGGSAGPAAQPCGDGGDREQGAVPLGPAGR